MRLRPSVSERILDDRINDILATLSSLTAELSQISRNRHSDNLTEVTIEGSANPRRVETTTDSLHRNNNQGERDKRGSANYEGLSQSRIIPLIFIFVAEESVSLSFEKHRMTSSTVRLNVGGKVFHASWQLLLQVPESRLG